jgi:hypothetical protein
VRLPYARRIYEEGAIRVPSENALCFIGQVRPTFGKILPGRRDRRPALALAFAMQGAYPPYCRGECLSLGTPAAAGQPVFDGPLISSACRLFDLELLCLCGASETTVVVPYLQLRVLRGAGCSRPQARSLLLLATPPGRRRFRRGQRGCLVCVRASALARPDGLCG